MIAEVIKIIPFKRSRNEGQIYLRVEFREEKTGKYLKTDLVPGFRNYKRWRKVARVGNHLANLFLKDEGTIDADSRPILLEGRQRHKESVEDLAKLGVFG